MKLLVLKSRASVESAKARLRRPPAFLPGQERKVAAILEAVRRQGDRALLEFCRRFDGTRLKAADLRIGPAEIREAYAKVNRAFIQSLKRVRGSISRFHERQKQASWRGHVGPGVVLGQLIRPIRRVGLCVPGGEAPLASSVLMSAVPAKVAGVEQLVLVTPNRGNQGVDPRLLVAADLSGVDEIYQVGGAQAVAALAYGTQTIAPVDKIVGPGSSWVALAQKLVFGTVGVDMIAGPSEILIVADAGADARYVAADLLSQAEHAGEESAILVTTSKPLAKRVLAELETQAGRLSKQRAIGSSLKRFGLVLVVPNLEIALELANAKAPEHLELMLRDAEDYLPRVRHAGAIFLGAYTPEAVGDYVAGPSHVLPTGGSARYASGLGVDSFVKRSSIIRYDRRALASASGDIMRLASAEGLTAHAASVSARGGKP